MFFDYGLTFIEFEQLWADWVRASVRDFEEQKTVFVTDDHNVSLDGKVKVNNLNKKLIWLQYKQGHEQKRRKIPAIVYILIT